MPRIRKMDGKSTWRGGCFGYAPTPFVEELELGGTGLSQDKQKSKKIKPDITIRVSDTKRIELLKY